MGLARPFDMLRDRGELGDKRWASAVGDKI